MKIKIVLIGAAAIGKTKLLDRLAGIQFNEAYQITIGMDFRYIGQQYQLWDCAGQERFASLLSSYYRGADVIFLCFDPRNRNSFDRVTRDILTAQGNAKPNCQYVLVETRSDLETDRQVSEEEIEQFKTEQRIRYHVPTSAKTGDGIDQLLAILAREHRLREGEELREPGRQSAPTSKKESRPKRKRSANDYSFQLNVLTAVAAVGGVALCVAALVTALVVGSVPLAASLLAGGLVLGTIAVGTFFYRRCTQGSIEKPVNSELQSLSLH